MKYLKKIPNKETYIDGNKVAHYYIEATAEDIGSLDRKENDDINCGQKIVYKYDIGGRPRSRYNSITEASYHTKIDASSIRRCANGEYKTAGGYIWKWS